MVHISPSPTPGAPRQPETEVIRQHVAEGPSMAATTGLPDVSHLSLNADGGNVTQGTQPAAVNPPIHTAAHAGPPAPNIHITIHAKAEPLIHANASTVTINTGPTTVHPDLGLPNYGQAQLFHALAPFVAPPALSPARCHLQGGAPVLVPTAAMPVNRNVQVPPPPYVQQSAPAPIVQQPAATPVVQQPAATPIVQQPAPAPIVQQPALAADVQQLGPAPNAGEFNDDNNNDADDNDDEYISASSPTETAPESPIIVGAELLDVAAAPAPFDFATAVAAVAAAANQVPLGAAADPALLATDEYEFIAPRDPDHRKWYVVTVGMRVGIWREWTDMSDFVTGVPRNSHQHFRSRAEAEAHYYGKKANGEVIVVEQ